MSRVWIAPALLILLATAVCDGSQGEAAASVVRPADRRSPGYRAYERANALFVAQKFPECQAALDEALRLDPKLLPALTLKAKLAMASHQFAAARESLERAIEADSSFWYAQFLYGLQYYLDNDLKLALNPLEKARRLNPRDPRSSIYLGLTYESLGRTAEALALYREARQLEEASGQVHADTLLVGSRLLLLLGRVEESEGWVRAALKSEPASRDAHFELARLLLAAGDAGRAAGEAESALRLTGGSATDSQIHYLLVRAYRETGREDLAGQHAEALRAIPPAIPK